MAEISSMPLKLNYTELYVPHSTYQVLEYDST